MNKTLNKHTALIIYVVLAALTFFAYRQVLHNDFVNYDDDQYITENAHVKNGFTYESLRWAFTTGHMANWHPVTWLSHMLDCELFNLSSGWHHLVNLLLHITNTLLLFWVLKRATGAIWCSGFVAAIFAIHPLHVESAAWVAERKDVLSGIFWMLTMAAYVRYAERRTIGRYLLVFISLALGLMAKPMLVTLPFALLLLDYWPLSRIKLKGQNNEKSSQKSGLNGIKSNKFTPKRLIAEKLPLFILAAVSSVVTYIFQQHGGAMEPGKDFSLGVRLSNAIASYLGYIIKTFYPVKLAPLYPHPGESLPIWHLIIAAATLVIVSAFIFYLRKLRYLTVGWLWYLGTLIPVIGIVQIGHQAMADRYTYLPSIGIFIMVAWGFAEIVKNLRHKKIITALPAAIVIIILILLTQRQVSYWKDNLTLFAHALSVTENNAIMENNYGNTIRKKGQAAESVKYFIKALELNPNYITARDNISQAYLSLDEIDKAIESCTILLGLDPNRASAWNNLGVALKKKGRIDEAIEKWKKTAQLNPQHSDCNYNLGLAFAEKGNDEEAVSYFKKAIEINPDNPNYYNDLGLAYFRGGKYDLAIDTYQKALQIDKDYMKAHYNIGCAYYANGNLESAIDHWKETERLNKDFVSVLANLAWVLSTAKDEKIRNPEEAIKYALRACELTGYNDIRMLDTLGVAYASAGRFNEAIEQTQKARKLVESTGKEDLIRQIDKKIELYRQKKPFSP